MFTGLAIDSGALSSASLIITENSGKKTARRESIIPTLLATFNLFLVYFQIFYEMNKKSFCALNDHSFWGNEDDSDEREWSGEEEKPPGVPVGEAIEAVSHVDKEGEWIDMKAHHAPFFCPHIECLQYYCEGCRASMHGCMNREDHKPLVKKA
ncbi:unnamed protein product, partial [Mesorhabditis belari]|uniref:Cytoplasmic polyadenylation element-binding protein ZZ domain-containing protein n=1 Tax=Mesorhabditis belari TaxID=2138241 RepID=A0AAF3FG61_9BILA